jgi:hypothetical protein
MKPKEVYKALAVVQIRVSNVELFMSKADSITVLVVWALFRLRDSPLIN